MKAISALMLAGTIICTATSASAAVVCNREGDCWRTPGRPHYHPGLRLRVMPDNWKWGHREHYRWRDHGHGHGYYRNGAWITIR